MRPTAGGGAMSYAAPDERGQTRRRTIQQRSIFLPEDGSMPRKVRELKRDLKRAGFRLL
jgi:hypothetical protein